MLEITPFKKDHTQIMLDQLIEPHEGLETEMMSAAKQNELVSDDAYTLFIDGNPWVSGGICLHHEGVAQGWLFVSERAKSRPVLVFKKIKKTMDYLFEKHKLRRIQVVVMAGFNPGERLALVLGFHLEAQMRGFGYNGETYNLYAKVRGE